MLHGRILRPPSRGAALRSADLSQAEAMPGVIAIHEGDLVGVAAPDATLAERALAAIASSAEWDEHPQPAEADLEAWLRDHPIDEAGWEGAFHHESGDVDWALASAPITLSATYRAASIAHVPLETRAAVAEWDADKGGRVTVWTGTQRPFGVREELAEALDLSLDGVRVVVPPTGSAYGGKHTGEVAIEAARLARAAGRPVKVRWSRAEEFAVGYLRPAAVIDVRAGLEPRGVGGVSGTVTAWEFRNINSGPMAILTPYDVPNQRIDYQPAESPLKQGSYRGLSATANTFARESAMDELAHELAVDPLAFRLRHLADDRLAAVFRAAAEGARWPGVPGRPGEKAGLGIAGGIEKDARVATCVQVRVEGSGELHLERIVTAFDCGAIVDRENLQNQVEGATVMALGGALFEEIHFTARRIVNGSMTEYRVPRFSDVPPIEVILIDRPDQPPAGAGETPMIAVAPAIANAIFSATGRRLRTMPLVPDGRVPD
jgi:nicotinate dehydrogenase subunit B